MNFILLTHEQELTKKNNSGKLVKELMQDDCDVIVWQRKEPNQALLELLAEQKAVLLFPSGELPQKDETGRSIFNVASEGLSWLSRYSHFVILDATWQQAKKIYRQSPYLQIADKLVLDQAPKSNFQRRRNQREGGLCTAECAIELLKYAGKEKVVAALTLSYEVFNQRQEL